MYRILNFLFGWDYIYWTNSADQGISKVFKAKDNKICYYRYRITGLIDQIFEPKQVIWLTCNSDKYFNPNKYFISEKEKIFKEWERLQDIPKIS